MNQIETPTPRTDEAYKIWHDTHHASEILNRMMKIERELTSVTEQRDRLAEALRKFVGDALFCSHADTATDVLPCLETGSAQNELTMP